jgi:2-polyprenyl-6-methoxyphenol hydroxylase-like FAD-dependent oxidoreductase
MHRPNSVSLVTRKVDVVVVGARAAGATTAMLLARFGLDVLLVDRSRYGSDTMSTHALMRGGVMQLSRWGLLDQVIAAGTPPVHRATFRFAGEIVPIDIKPAHGIDALYAPRRTVLDPILVDAAVAAGVDVRFGVTVADIMLDADGAARGVTGHTADGQPFHARARLVIGADGIRSRVAARVGAAAERVGTASTSVTYGYWDGLETDGYEWIFRPDAAAGVIPTNDGQSCVFVSASPRRIGRGGLDVLRAIAAESSADLAARLDAATSPTSTRTFAGMPGHVRRSWGRGWALVGDAGYYKDPLSAHGLTDALRDAELLARAVVLVVVDGVDERDALAGYQATRDSLSAALFDVIDVIAGHGWTDDEIGVLLRQLTEAMGDEVETIAALPAVPPPLDLRRRQPALAG